MHRLTHVTLLAAALGLGAPTGVLAQSPTAATLSELHEGLRIRTNGPGVRELFPPSFGEVLLRGGLMALFIRPPTEGVVVAATPEALRFAEGGSQPVSVPWSGVDYVDSYLGRSAAAGALQGAGLGLLTGLVGWGVIELLFLAADNPVVDEPGIVLGIGAAAGTLVGAATLGHRWDRIYLAEDRR